MRMRAAGGVSRLWRIAALAGVTAIVTACGAAEPDEDASAPTTAEETADSGNSAPPSSVSVSAGVPASLTPLPKALDGDVVEKAVRTVLTDSFGVSDVEGVRCPRRPAVREGATFDCTAVIDGESKRIPIEILDDDGRYEVGLPV